MNKASLSGLSAESVMHGFLATQYRGQSGVHCNLTKYSHICFKANLYKYFTKTSLVKSGGHTGQNKKSVVRRLCSRWSEEVWPSCSPQLTATLSAADTLLSRPARWLGASPRRFITPSAANLSFFKKSGISVKE